MPPGINTFDIAFQSRIHLALMFPDMNEESQKAVFKMFLRGIREDQMDRQGIEDWIESLFDNIEARPEFNGRQIRNILAGAINMARAKGQKLEVSDVNTLCSRTKVFQKILHDDVNLQIQVDKQPRRNL